MDNQKLNVEEILDNEVVTTQKIENVQYQKSDDGNVISGNQHNNKFDDTYVHIYSGKAMNERELLSFSARNKTNLILVAGPFASGKTTLMVMMYFLFKEGYNKKLKFKSSCTIKGYLERSRSLLLNSGNSMPDTERTPIKAEDLFLNLNLVNEDGKNSNLVFADLSGEMFKNQDYLNEVPECCSYTKNKDDLSYYMGYYLEQANKYVIAKTWYADEMLRSGCVWTHSIIFNMNDFSKINNFDTIIKLFRRPKLNNYIGYGIRLEIDEKSQKPNFDNNELLAYVIYTIYGNSLPRFIYFHEKDDNILQIYFYPRISGN